MSSCPAAACLTAAWPFCRWKSLAECAIRMFIGPIVILRVVLRASYARSAGLTPTVLTRRLSCPSWTFCGGPCNRQVAIKGSS